MNNKRINDWRPIESAPRAANLDTRAKMKALDVDDYDLDILRPVFKTLRERKSKS